MRAQNQAVVDPYLPYSDLSIILTGQWQSGGVMEISVAAAPVAAIEFSAPLWSTVALLMIAAIHSQTTHWPNAFITSEDLAKALESKNHLVDATPSDVHRLINKIRAAIARSVPPELAGKNSNARKEWAHILLASRRSIGYRIAVPPKNLTVNIGQTVFGTNAPRSGGDQEGQSDGSG